MLKKRSAPITHQELETATQSPEQQLTTAEGGPRPPADEPPSSTTVFLNRKRLKKRWLCSDSSIKRREKDGLKATRIGPRAVRYRLSDVEEFESSH